MKREPTEFDAFTRLVDQVLSVPRDEILRREAEYKKQADQNPKKRGPKSNVKRRASASRAAKRI